MTNDLEIQEIQEFNNLIDKAKKNRLIFSHADETIKNIFTLYFSGEDIHKNISLISSKYLVSGFALLYLKILNDILEKKYEIHQLTLDDFFADNIRKITAKLEDETIIKFLNECSEKLNNNIDNIDADDIDKLIKLGHIIDLSIKDLSYRERIKGIEVYDIIYRYLNRINSLGLTKYRGDDINIKIISKRNTKVNVTIKTTETLTTRDKEINISMETS